MLTAEKLSESKNATAEGSWHLELFRKSVLKQAKLRNLVRAIGETQGKTCLDLGSDNGVISYFLRERGGTWSSADLTNQAVQSITSLVKERVYLIEEETLPFHDGEFDLVVVVDMLEHVPDDRGLIAELSRILKPKGMLVLNVPNLKHYSLLRWFRHCIGQTDEAHGHLRPGYSREGLEVLFGERFRLERNWTYSRFFSELVDTAIVFAYSLLSRGPQPGDAPAEPSKGLVVTEEEMRKFKKKFRLYGAIYPIVWLFSKLDWLMPFCSGYMRLTTARRVE